MEMSAQVSVYPLRQPQLGPAVEAVRLACESGGLDARVGPMSTLVRGEVGRLFAALHEAFERVAEMGDVAMVVTLSNACPGELRDARVVGDL